MNLPKVTTDDTRKSKVPDNSHKLLGFEDYTKAGTRPSKNISYLIHFNDIIVPEIFCSVIHKMVYGCKGIGCFMVLC